MGAKCTASKEEPSCTCSHKELLPNERRQVHGVHARIAEQPWEFCTATATTATHEVHGTQAPKLQTAAGQQKKNCECFLKRTQNCAHNIPGFGIAVRRQLRQRRCIQACENGQQGGGSALCRSPDRGIRKHERHANTAARQACGASNISIRAPEDATLQSNVNVCSTPHSAM